MSEIAFHKYKLQWRGESRYPREGALLRVFQKDGSWGYADCHPWIEFGDEPLDSQLKLLKRGMFTPLLRQSLNFTKEDALARKNKRNLFQGLVLPQNHYHISDQSLISESLIEDLSIQGFQLVKVKGGVDLQSDVNMLARLAAKMRSSHLKFRLDFNCRPTEKQFLIFLEQISSYTDLIDYIEDPFPYQPESWQRVRERYQVSLACDMDSAKALDYPSSCDFLVVKPAIQNVEPFLGKLNGRQLVLTSYLDHPIGQLSGLFTAATLLKNMPEILSDCGFLTHHAYEPTSFSETFSHIENRLIPSLEGTGWGCDEILKTLDWRELND